jgi:hypothetical protein
VDLLSIIRKIWRYKFVTVPVLLLTMVGAAYVVGVKKPTYEASSSFALLLPPPPPSADQIAKDPSLARLKTDNPYTRFGDQQVIIQVLANTISSSSARQALARAGVDPRYIVMPSSTFGLASTIVQISAVSSTPAGAVKSARIVDDAVTKELDRMQAQHGTDPGWRIKALSVLPPDNARLQASAQLRTLVGVLVLGTVMLFIVISIADAISTLRYEHMHGRPAVQPPVAYPAAPPAVDLASVEPIAAAAATHNGTVEKRFWSNR